MDSIKGEVFALLAALTWATSVIFFRVSALKFGALAFTTFKTTVACILFFVTGLVLLPISDLVAMIEQHGWILALSALMGIVLGDVLFVAGLNRIGATLSAIVDCAYTPMVMIFAIFVFDETLSVLGFVGASMVVSAVLVGTEMKRKNVAIEPKLLWTGILFGILSQLFMVIGVLMIRDIIRDSNIIWILGYRFFIGSTLLLGYLYFKGELGSLKDLILPKNLKVTLPGAILGPFVASLFWFGGFKYASAPVAAVFNQMSTIFIVIFAYVFLKEPMTPRRFMAVMMGFGGALIVAFTQI